MTAVVASLGGPRAMWYATRGSGVVSLVLLSAIVCLGVAGVRRLGSEHWPRFLVVGLHRNLTLVALVFLVLHIGTTVLDGFAPIKLQDAVIPFVSAYRPIWLGLGAVAFDLLLALTISSLLRARFGYRTWRALHWLAYAAWPVALVHALGTGSDGGIGWLQLLALALTAAVIAAVVARLADASTSPVGRLAGGAALLLVPLGMLLWYASGPGARGWAARSGTPAALLPHRVLVPAPAALPSASPPVSGALPAAPYTAALRGRLSSTQGADGLVLVSIRGTTRAPAKGVLWIRLRGRPIDGGVAMSSSGASYGPASEPDQYRGSIVSLRGTQIVLALHGQPGALALRVDLRIDGVSHRVTGTVAAAAGSEGSG